MRIRAMGSTSMSYARIKYTQAGGLPLSERDSCFSVVGSYLKLRVMYMYICF